MENKIMFFLIFLTITSTVYPFRSVRQPLGGFSICKDLYKFITENISPGSTILELGSGEATELLSQNYIMYSVEHDESWLNKYNSNYLHAPIVDYVTYKWYDNKNLKKILPNKYDMILIDGPPGNIGRYGFFENLYLFDVNVLMIFDDIQRPAEFKLMKDVAVSLNRNYFIYKCSDGKRFGVINKSNDASGA